MLLEAGDGEVALASDHLGNIDLATDASGAERGRRHYVVPSGDAVSAGHVDEYGFSGQEEVASIGLVRFQYRWLDPLTLRWTQPDPAFEEVSELTALRAGEATDRYAYVGNDPMNAIDPTGLSWETVAGWASTAYNAFFGGGGETNGMVDGQRASVGRFGVGGHVLMALLGHGRDGLAGAFRNLAGTAQLHAKLDLVKGELQARRDHELAVHRVNEVGRTVRFGLAVAAAAHAVSSIAHAAAQAYSAHHAAPTGGH
jgi:RHS repeat-associated protein